MNNISAVIVAKGKPLHILKTIDSIYGFVQEIIVIDIGIHDDLKNQLKNNKNINLIKINRNIPYVELIREELKKYCEHEYILYLDPDEILSSELKQVLTNNLKNYDYFLIPRKNIIFGKWIKNSRWWPDYQARLFKKNACIWPKEIHIQPQTKGKEFKIEPKEELAIIHYNYNNLDEYFEKYLRYAKFESNEYIKNRKDISLQETIKKGISEFISRFFANKGYQDGMHGFVLSFLQMFYYFIVYFYYWEKKKYFEVNKKELFNSTNNYFKTGLYEVNHWKNKYINTNFFQEIKNKIANKLLK